MHLPKNYIHDKLILLLVSGNVFLAFLCTVLIFLRLNIGQGAEGYIVQYRSNLGISAFQNGGAGAILAFAAFTVLTLAITVILSIRTYSVRRELAVSLLSAGILVLVLAIIVSNALIALH